MTGQDWAAWIAVKAVVAGACCARSRPSSSRSATTCSATELNLDGTKGNPMSFRAWDHQLRQPILLATAQRRDRAAADRGLPAPDNDLDTLGVDEPETACQF